MRYTLKTDEGKVVVLDTKTDLEVYGSPENPPNTGTQYTRGTDLFMHKARSGKKYYYLRHWSMWQGENGSVHLISEEQAKEFFMSKLANSGWDRPADSEIKEFEELFPDALEETA